VSPLYVSGNDTDQLLERKLPILAANIMGNGSSNTIVTRALRADGAETQVETCADMTFR
jgi:hypothetical protein